MSRHRSGSRYERDHSEREPLDSSYEYSMSPPAASPGRHRHHEYDNHSQPYQDNLHRGHSQSQPEYSRGGQQDQSYHSAYRPPPQQTADRSFDRRRTDRRQDRDQQPQHWAAAPPPSYPSDYVSPVSPPQPTDNSQRWGQNTSYNSRTPPKSNVTPGADNFSASAGGGMAGIAYQVADRNARESGIEAMRTANPHQPNYPDQAYQFRPQPQPQSQYRGDSQHNVQMPPHPPQHGAGGRIYNAEAADSDSSLAGLGASHYGPGHSTPGSTTPSRSPRRVYTDDPYSGYSRPPQPALGVVNPHDIYDDADDGLDYGRRNNRSSMLSLGALSKGSGKNDTTAAAAVGATAGAVGGGLAASRAGGYNPVNSGSAFEDARNSHAEKNWGRKPEPRSKKWKIVVIALVGIAIIAGLVLGILFGYVLKNNGGGGDTSGQSAEEDQQANGDLNVNSKEIQTLMNNPNLHKVFMGMDYTPLNTQYPDCLKFPPSQNNVTRDVAVLSKLTNVIRVYGTDCNQTEMVIHAIDQLKLKGQVKVWIGVWQDGNSTTNKRQLDQMWNILDKYASSPNTPTSYFKGLIVANEILFRQEMTLTDLTTLLKKVRSDLNTKGMGVLPVATSDLGRDWSDSSLVDASDYIMANIHPFFGGVEASQATNWTMEFWKNNIPKQKSEAEKNVIAEYGWPSQGGKRCPADDPSCAVGSVAGISQLNQVLQDWVCPALDKNINYFWFSAFDEPWKIRFNTANENWEDHWGLMDVNRKLKSGLQIPDCGGKTAPAA